MAKSINKVTIVGNLGADAQLQTSARGTSYCRFSVATQRYNPNSDAEPVTDWHNVTVFGRQAEFCGEVLKKGHLAFVEGRIEYYKYERDGDTRYGTSIVASDVVPMSRKDAPNSEQTGQNSQSNSFNDNQNKGNARQATPPSSQRDEAEGFVDDDIPF